VPSVPHYELVRTQSVGYQVGQQSCPAAPCTHSPPAARAARLHTRKWPQGDFIRITDAVNRLGLPPRTGHDPAPLAPKLPLEPLAPSQGHCKRFEKATAPMVPALPCCRPGVLRRKWLWLRLVRAASEDAGSKALPENAGSKALPR